MMTEKGKGRGEENWDLKDIQFRGFEGDGVLYFLGHGFWIFARFL